MHIFTDYTPTLVNTGRYIIFRDSMNTILDSLKYSPTFGVEAEFH